MSMMETPLAVRAETAIRRLRDVEGVSVRVDGSDLVEIHVVSSSDRSPKQIVRDVQAVLRTDLGMSIDHRIVSVALARAPGAAPASATPAAPVSARAPAPSRAPSRAPEPSPPEPVRDDRIRYENANLIVHGQKTQAQVELRWKGLPRIGNASGWSSRDDSHRLVAQATALAVQEFLSDPIALNVRDVSFVEAGGHRVAVVVMSARAPARRC
jgi:hypothetical protein